MSCLALCWLPAWLQIKDELAELMERHRAVVGRQ